MSTVAVQTQLNAITVNRIHQDVGDFRKNFESLSLQDARRELQRIGAQIYEVRGDVGKLPEPLRQKMETSYAHLESLKNLLEQKEMQRLLGGADLLAARGNQFHNPWGTAACGPIVGKALEKMLSGTLSNREAMDEVVKEGIKAYQELIGSLQAKVPGFYSQGRHLGWEHESEEAFDTTLQPVGDPIRSMLTMSEREVFQRVLTDLWKKMEGDHIGGVLLVGREYFAVSMRKIESQDLEVCIFDSHGKYAFTKGNSPAFMVKTHGIGHAADLLAYRREYFETDRHELNEITCYPVCLVEETETAALVVHGGLEIEEEGPSPVVEKYTPIVTAQNREQALALVEKLRGLENPSKDEIQEILAQYPACFTSCYEEVSHQVEEESSVASMNLLLLAELQFLTAGLMESSSPERPIALHTPVVSREQPQRVEVLGNSPAPRPTVDFQARRELVANTTQTATLFMRDYVLDALIDKSAVNQEVILRNMEGWFSKFLPTLFFEEGEGTSTQKADLGLVSGALGSMTSFLRDNSAARHAVMSKQPRNWLCQRTQLEPKDLESRMISHMRRSKERPADRVVLNNFSEQLLTLYMRTQGKVLNEPMKREMVHQVTTILEALIETVLSPRFAQMLAIGFLEDDEIGAEILAVNAGNTGDFKARDVPEELHREMTQLVSELIDFGNPRYSSWIAMSMMKTHFMKTENPGWFKASYRSMMRFMSSPVFQDEVGALLQNAFALPKRPTRKEEWVKTATLGVKVFHRYAWDEAGRSCLGQVQVRRNIPEQLYTKTMQLVSAGGVTFRSKLASYMMPSVHTLGQTLTGRLYDLSQSTEMMRLYSVHYLIGDTLIPHIRVQCASINVPRPLPIIPAERRTVSHELGDKASTLISDYLQKYVSELYLKQDSPLVSGVVDLGVSMIEKFVSPMIATTYLSNDPYTVPQQQMIVDVYGAVGPFLCDYSAAVQEAKKDPQYPVYEKQGRGDVLILRAMEKVRKAPLKISDRDIEAKLEALSDLLVRSNEVDLSPLQTQLLRSSSFVLPKLLKGTMDLIFSPQMMNLFMTNMLDSLSLDIPHDPDHQYQKWDNQVLINWNSSLLALVKGVTNLGEPTGKMAEVMEVVSGVSDLAQANLGSLIARLSSGPSPLLSPAAYLATLNTLEKTLFGPEKSRRMENVFNVTRGEMVEREALLKSKIQGLLVKPLPLDHVRSLASEWAGTAQHLIGLGQSAHSHVSAALESVPLSVSSSESPIGRWAADELHRQTEALGLSGILNLFSSVESGAEVTLSQTLQKLLYGKISETLQGHDIVSEFVKGNPILSYLDNMCGNVMQFIHSKELMRAYVYNYVLTPTFFKHLIQNIETQGPIFQSNLALQLPSSLFVDMEALSWVVPGERNAVLPDTPKLVNGVGFHPPHSAYGYEDRFLSVQSHLKDRERLFEASKACPMLNMLFQKLATWEEQGVVGREHILGCVNTLERPQAFLENAQGLVGALKSKGVVTEDEALALNEQLQKGEFPFVFRYLDLKMMDHSNPVVVAVYGSNWKEELTQQFLSKAIGGLDGALMQHVETLQLIKSYDHLIEPYLLGKHEQRLQMQAVLDILASDKKEEKIGDKLEYLLKETFEYVKNLKSIDRLFLSEIVQGFGKAEDPLSNAVQMFSINQAVDFWEKSTQIMHQTFDQLQSENPRILHEMEPQLKAYYEKLGVVLSELLTDPLSDKLKVAISTQFRDRYRAAAVALAPKMGTETQGRVGTVGSWSPSRAFHKLEIIKQANKSIVMSGCYFGGQIFDTALDLFGQQLIAKPALDVKLIGSEYMLTPSNRECIATLESAFPGRFMMQITKEVQHYKSPFTERSIYRTNHTKLLVIDYGKYFEIGGSGIADKWELPGTQHMRTKDGSRSVEPMAFRDMDYIFHDQEEYGVGYGFYLQMLDLFPSFGAKDIKERIASSFDPRFNHVVPPSKAEAGTIPWGFSQTDAVTFYSSGPDQEVNQMYLDLVKDVKGATKQIGFYHMYFHPPKELLDALIEASNRGVAIFICTNRDGADMPYTHSLFAELSRSNWKALFEGKEKPNVNIYEFNVANTTYHKKAVVIDQRVTYLGSSNIGEKSFGMSDQEMDVRIVSNGVYTDIIQNGARHDMPLLKQVPPKEAPHQKINEAAMAQVQALFLKPWL